MATPQAIQAEGDPSNTLNVYTIQKSITIDATYDGHYCVGQGDPYNNTMWVRTTSAESAADQNADILAALVAGPCDTNALDN